MRRIAWTALAVVLLALGVGSAFVLPRVGAIRFLIAMGRPSPKDGARLDESRDVSDEGFGPHRMRILVPEAGPGAPAMVVVHGVTEKGIDDGRLLGLAAAFREAGFVVLLPEVGGLVTFPADGGDGDRLLALLRALGKGRVAEADPARFGVFGVSVGGPLALATAARYRAEGGTGLRAVLLVGAPDDIRRTARGWFAEPVPAPGLSEGAKRRADDAEFARAMIRRAGLDAEVPVEDREAVRAWMQSAWIPKGEPEGLRTEAARAFVTGVRHGPTATAAEADRAVEAAWPTLRLLSAAHADGDYAALRGVPVFLVHGVDDTLVPVSELPLLEARLRPCTAVRTLKSSLLGHVDVRREDAWDHVLFLDEVFDAITD